MVGMWKCGKCGNAVNVKMPGCENVVRQSSLELITNQLITSHQSTGISQVYSFQNRRNRGHSPIQTYRGL